MKIKLSKEQWNGLYTGDYRPITEEDKKTPIYQACINKELRKNFGTQMTEEGWRDMEMAIRSGKWPSLVMGGWMGMGERIMEWPNQAELDKEWDNPNQPNQPIKSSKSSNMKIKLSKEQWRMAGLKAGWIKKADLNQGELNELNLHQQRAEDAYDKSINPPKGIDYRGQRSLDDAAAITDMKASQTEKEIEDRQNSVGYVMNDGYNDFEPEAFDLSVLGEDAQYPMFVNAYKIDKVYGGPEEGGWWYDYHELLESAKVKTSEEAKNVTNKFWEKHKDQNDFEHDLSSAISDGKVEIFTEQTYGEQETKTVPHYE